jgi:hypothetical protein
MEGKKSFVLYTDQREVFDELDDVTAGKLIKHIFAYVNDENPSTDDLLLKVAFLPIKTQLKRDLRIWDEKKQQRTEAGRKGGLAKASNASEVLAKPSNAKKDVANLAVNVNVNGNVNDIYTETEKTLEVNEESHNEIFRQLWKSNIWLEGIAVKNKAKIPQVLDHLNEFRQECILKDELKVDEKDAKQHFINWIKRGNPIPEKKEGETTYAKSTLQDNWW